MSILGHFKRIFHKEDSLKIGQIVTKAILYGHGEDLCKLIKEDRLDYRMPIMQKIGYDEKDVAFIKKHKKAIIRRYYILLDCRGDLNKLAEYVEAGEID